MVIAKGHDPKESPVIVEEANDPEEAARLKAGFDRFQKNSKWLQGHWNDLLPQALGKFVAVAGQEAFIADTPEAAWALAGAAHPEDDGAFCQYVSPHRGPRIYANQG